MIAWALGLVALLGVAREAEARPYTVASCDAALNASVEGWVSARTTGRSYSICPSRGSDTAGISDRATDVTVSGLAYSAHTFSAPPGTTISSIQWGGRMARANCRWGAVVKALPSGSVVLGLPAHSYCATGALDFRPTPVSFPVAAGTSALQQIVACSSSSCQPGATLHTTFAVVTIDDPTAPAIALEGPLVGRRWVGGQQDLRIIATDNTGVSSYSVSLGADVTNGSKSCSYTRPAPCPDHAGTIRLATDQAPQGHNELVVTTVDAAGNASQARHPVRVDNEPPTRVKPIVDGGEDWRRANGYAIRWANQRQAYAPIVAARYRLCASAGCTEGRVARSDVDSLPRIALPTPGDHTLEVWLEDEAGNQSHDLTASDPVHLRLDPEAPGLSFQPQDPGDPLRVTVDVEDRYSGLESGEIELRRRSGRTWHSLATAREGSQLVAYVDDERYRTGAFEFRAFARDAAGNEASTDRLASGAKAGIELPVRFATRLSVGITRKARQSRRGRTARRIVPRARARQGTKLKLRGRLQNADGQPIDGGTLEVSADSPGDDTGLLPVGLARTNASGRFSYIVRATRNKVLRFRYPGSERIRAATQDFQLSVPAASTIRARPRQLRNGQTVKLSGRVLTRPLPSTGKLIEVQAFFRSRWRTFSTTRSNRSGRWRFRYRFGGTHGRVPYRLRVRLPAEGAYPFASGASRAVRVVVTGP